MMWFSPPRELTTRMMTRLPDRFRIAKRNEWTEANMAGATAEAALEGPCFDASGRLYVVDIPFGRIFRIEQDNWALVAHYDGWPNGLKVASDGTLIAADYRRGLMRIDPSAGTAVPLLGTISSEGFKGVNDLTLHPNGAILFTDQGQTGLHDPTGRVWRFWPDGRLDRLIANAPSPNGLVLNRAKTHLYIAMTRSAQIWVFALRDDAVVNKVQCFSQLPGGSGGPDGLAVDSHDRLFICDPGHGCVWVLDAHGEPCFRIVSCAGRVLTNCALAADGRTLVITDASTQSILACEIPPPAV
ncbi:MAG: SMP-30/gluconolactonase/LRE family protein [Proteobacteria bacterium]|nr:SMP-30/gluconolactonase/LRE family protein [Pseudomonadota bacterium]